MWMVFLNGGWQPADSDGIVIAWIHQGLVGPQTQIRHSSWPQPAMAAAIQNFAGYFVRAPTPMQPWQGPLSHPMPLAPTPPSKAPKIIGAVFGGLIIMGIASAATFAVPAVGVLLFIFVLAGGTAVALHKYVPAAPAPLRTFGGFLLEVPAIALAVYAGLLVGAMSGFGQRAAQANECNDTVRAASKAVGDDGTFANAPDPMKVLYDLNVRISKGRTACESIGLTAQRAALDGYLMTLTKQANAGLCLATSKSVLDDIKTINGPHEPEEGLQLLTTFKAKLENGIVACNRAGDPDLASALKDTETKQVDPQIETLRPLAAASLAQKQAGAAAAKAKSDATAKAAAASAQAAALTANTIKDSCLTLATLFGTESKLSDLQKDEKWPAYRGKNFAWDLQITEVSSGVLSGYTVQAKCAPNSSSFIQDIQIEYDSDAKNFVLQLQKGGTYKLRGTLRGSSTVFGLTADGTP